MNARQLAAILDDVSGVDLDQMTCDALVDWLAESIRRHTGADVVKMRSAVIPEGASEPPSAERVFGGVETPIDEANPPTVGELRLFGRPPVLGDLRVVSHEVITGPKDDWLLPLTAGQQCLVVRVRSDRDLSYVLVAGDASLAQTEVIEQWQAALPPLLRVALRRLSPLDADSVHGRRQTFYQTLLDYDPTGKAPAEDFKHICEAWQEVSNADWVSLWMYNSRFAQLELTAFSAKEPESEPDRALPREHRTRSVSTGIAAYCAKTRQAAYVTDVRRWQRELDGVVYRFPDPDVVEQSDYQVFDFVPLFTSDAGSEPNGLPIVGLVVLHFADAHTRVPHHQEGLLTMGLVTALSIRKSQATEQREILVELNNLAQRHLASVSRRPVDVRTEYLAELIGLIKQRLHAGGVSIFYRMRFEDAVQCLATTGIEDHDGHRIPDERLGEVIYEPDEGLTGQCYAEAKLKTHTSRTGAPGRLGKFPEVRHVAPTGSLDPIALVPIPGPPDGTEPAGRALGVIRCVEHTCNVFQGELCNFDAAEIETLGFIADQVSPVLQMFEQRIERERTVSVVKHDLFAPLAMIRDIANDALDDLQEQRPPKEYDLLDTVVCSELAMKLVDELDLDPSGASRVLRPEPTGLEGDIVARLKNMLSHHAYATKRMRIHFEGLREIPVLNVDSEKVERAIYNLLLNAIKYGDEGSTIEVEARRADRHFVVDVSNYGIGIDPSEEPHLFKPYFRSPRARAASAEGVGLGLTIAKTIMQQHGGDLRVTSRKDPTVFSLLFPKTLVAKKEDRRHAR